LFGLRLPDTAVPLGPLGGPFAVARLAAEAFAVFATGRAFVRGRGDGVVFGGTVVLGITVIHDVLHSFGTVPGPPLGPFGFFAFVGGVVLTLLWRYEQLRGELEQRATVLKGQGREIARAYEELRAAQDELVRKEQLAAVGELSAVIAHEV